MFSQTDIKFSSNSRPRAKTQQLGSQEGFLVKPHIKKLRDFEQLALYDTSTSFGLYALIDTVIALLGEIEHPDEEIQAFCRENVNRLGSLDSNSSSLYSSLYKIIHSYMWAGFSVTENLYKVDKGNLWLDGFVTYHPATIIFRPNRKGRLVENEATSDSGYTSGIWQSANDLEKKLPLWKVIRLTRSEMYGNYYGISILESVYKWAVLKEALLDMMAVALDRFGNPVVALTFPLHNTNEVEIDADTGEERSLTTKDLMQRQIQNNQFSTGGNALLLPQIDEKMVPKAQVLTTGNNVGSTFLDAINNCDRETSKGLLMPYGLLSNDASQGAEATEQQMEMFNRILRSVYAQTIQPIVSQSFHRLVRLNFNRESAKIAPTIPLKPSNRAEDKLSLMQVVSGLTSSGYLNPQNSADWNMVRDWVNGLSRPMDKKDTDFIQKMLIEPRQPSSSGGKGNDSNPSRAKGTAGTQPKGSGPGRPVGSSSPKMNVAGTKVPS